MPLSKKTSGRSAAQIKINYADQAEPDFLFGRRERDHSYVGEGQLSCDVYQDADDIYVVSMLAGVEPQDLDISVSHDVLTIRGLRRPISTADDSDIFARECYFGPFSRSIILPQEIDPSKVTANLKNGILTISLTKKYKATTIKIRHVPN